MLNRRQFLASAVAVAGARAAVKKQAPPPNIVVVAIDGLGAWMTGAYGAQDLRTPNLDRIADTGTRFLHAFSASPVAQPGFESLMTGLSPMQAAGSANTLDKVLGGHGYRTVSVVEGDMNSVSEQALRFLDGQAANQPFCAVARYAPLREAGKVPEKYAKLFADNSFTHSGWLPAAENATDKKVFASILGPLRESAAAIAACDDQLPVLQRKLQERGVAENTLLLIVGTSGVLLGRHGLWGDGRASTPPNMFDEVVNVPFIWTWPSGVPGGIVRPEVVSLCDVLPTICELAAVPAPGVSGRSVAPSVLSQKYPKKQPWRDRAYAAFEGTSMARDSRYKLVLHQNGPGELYDLNSDAGELRNRFDDPEFMGVRADLGAQLNAWK